jgi:hypothetical protein
MLIVANINLNFLFRHLSLPLIPQDLQNIIIDEILQSDMPDKQLLQLSLVCKRWSRFVKGNQLWNSRLGQLHYITVHGVDFDILPPKLRYFWLKNRRVDLDTCLVILDPAKQAQYEKYAPWLNHNLLKCPEILLKFLRAWVMVPEWMFFLVVARVRNKKFFMVIHRPRNNRGFYKNIRNVERIERLQQVIIVSKGAMTCTTY